MSSRVHADFVAYSSAAPYLDQARLFSLKLEQIDLSPVRRRYVDALLLSGVEIVPILFIHIAEDGTAILHEHHRALHPAVQEWLAKTAAEWVAAKGPEANLQADLFDSDVALRNDVMAVMADERRAFAGLSPYSALFTEAERYANLSPFVIGRDVVDFNPGTGYGARTLAAAASTVSIPSSELTSLTKRLRPALAISNGPADVAVRLDVAAAELPAVLETLKAALREPGAAVVSMRGGEEAGEVLRSAGADGLKMTRPGCDGLGDLGEWLGVFKTGARPRHFDMKAPADLRAATITVCERPLRILFGLRPSAQSIFGGDVVQVRETAEALRARGHFVEVSTAASLGAANFDVVHLTNITVPPETLPQAQSVADFGGAVVMMPIFTDHSDEAVWGMNVTTSVYGSHADLQDLGEKLARDRAAKHKRRTDSLLLRSAWR